VSWDDNRDGNHEIYFALIGCGNCNLTGLDIIPVASLPGGTINLVEGAQRTFTAACTYTGSTCGVLSDDCGQGQGVNWLFSGQVSLSTPGPSTSTIATANQIPGQNGGLGQVSGSAIYGAGSFSDSTNITITNNDTLSTVDVTPNSTVTLTEGASQLFKAKATFTDGCTEQVACGGLLGATTWTVTGQLTAGTCASNQKTISANQIPGPAGGSGTVNATYGGLSDTVATAVTITNNDTCSALAITPDPATIPEGGSQLFKVKATWSDGFTEQVACDAGTTWTITGQLIAGSCAANQKSIIANQIPCGASGSGTVNASYDSCPPPFGVLVTIPNDDWVATLNVTPNSTVTLMEGGSQLFKALAIWNDACTEQVACGGMAGATTWTVTGNLSAGGCASNQKTITASQIPCGAGGAGTVNATYQTKSDASASAVTVPNDDTKSLVTVVPGSVSFPNTGGTQDFYAYLTWSDGCTGPDDAGGWTRSGTCTDSSVDGNGLYSVGDQAGPACIDTVTKSDPPAAAGSAAIAVAEILDSDGDGMPDAWEAKYSSCMHPLIYDDPMADYDGDGLENINEYYNDWDANVSDPCDPYKPLYWGKPGIGYFGDADGSMDFGGSDLNQIVMELSGSNPSYDMVYPSDRMVQDLDGDGGPSGGDLNIMVLMLSGNVAEPEGWPWDLTKVEPADGATVKVGRAVVIKVLLTRYYGSLERPGFGVVFRVSEGAATLYGGEGLGVEPDSRYDLTNISGEARMAVRVDAAGTIRVHVEVPGANPFPDHMLTDAIRLEPDVGITGVAEP
jgi:hypothetical protein